MSRRTRLSQNKRQDAALQTEQRLMAAVMVRPDTEELRDIPVVDQQIWTVDAVRDAVAQHVNGNFGRSSMLTDAMLADDRIQGATNGRTKGVTKRTVKLTPNPKVSNKRLATKVALDVENQWAEMFPEELIEDILKWQIFDGFNLNELIWKARSDMWIPRIKIWHPQFMFYWITDRMYHVVTMDNGSLAIEPNDPKWALYTPYGSYRGWMRGAVRSVAIPWLVRQYALRDWARYSEVHGLPQKKAKVPASAPVEDKRRFFSAVQKLGSESSFLLPVPQGGSGAEWDIELMEAKDTSWKGFEGLINRCDKSITLTIRGTNLTTEVQTGTGAATKAHRDEDSDYADADSRKLAEFIKKQVLSYYALYNYGDASLAPIPVFESDADTKDEESKVLGAVAEAIGKLKTAGWNISPEQIEEKFGLVLEAPAPVEIESGFVLTPTDIASVVTVNEARASLSLQPIDGGDVTVTIFNAPTPEAPQS